MKKVALAIMVMFMMGSLFAPVCYAGETQDITMKRMRKTGKKFCRHPTRNM